MQLADSVTASDGGASSAKRTKCAHLLLFGANAAARRLYERCGWVDKGLVRYEVPISGGRTYPLQLVRERHGDTLTGLLLERRAVAFV